MLKHLLEGRIRMSENMTGLEELKVAYLYMSKEFGFLITDVIFDDTDERCELVFKWFGVGLRTSFRYEFILGFDPYGDDIIFYGDPYTHFSIACYQAITKFLATLQAHRSDDDTMMAFIDYLKEQCDEYSN